MRRLKSLKKSKAFQHAFFRVLDASRVMLHVVVLKYIEFIFKVNKIASEYTYDVHRDSILTNHRKYYEQLYSLFQTHDHAFY